MSKEKFSSSHAHTIDAKNRFFIPAQYRSVLGTEIELVRSPDKNSPCIFIYTREHWDEICESIESLPPSPQTRLVQRMLLYGAMPVELDKTGRVSLSKDFKDFAHIDKDIVLVGAGVRVEIWAAEEWNKQLSENIDISEDILQSLPY